VQTHCNVGNPLYTNKASIVHARVQVRTSTLSCELEEEKGEEDRPGKELCSKMGGCVASPPDPRVQGQQPPSLSELILDQLIKQLLSCPTFPVAKTLHMFRTVDM